MDGNGVPLIRPPKASVTFHFAENGDLARIDGEANLNQLLIIAFESTLLAQGIRSQMMMRQQAEIAQLAIVRDHLGKEKHGRK